MLGDTVPLGNWCNEFNVECWSRRVQLQEDGNSKNLIKMRTAGWRSISNLVHELWNVGAEEDGGSKILIKFQNEDITTADRRWRSSN